MHATMKANRMVGTSVHHQKKLHAYTYACEWDVNEKFEKFLLKNDKKTTLEPSIFRLCWSPFCGYLLNRI